MKVLTLSTECVAEIDMPLMFPSAACEPQHAAGVIKPNLSESLSDAE